MKFPSRYLLLAGAFAVAGPLTASAQRSAEGNVIPRVQVQDGSNASRAPFISQRTFDDAKSPDGKALDENVPPNTAATAEPAPPPATVAVLQRDRQVGEPQLAMTGRPTVGVAAGLDSTQVVTTIRGYDVANRDALVADIDTRLKTSTTTLKTHRDGMAQMSAEGRTQFRTATDNLEAKEKALRKSLQAARKASATEWDAARAQLAADYEAYAAAAAQIDASAGIAPAQR